MEEVMKEVITKRNREFEEVITKRNREFEADVAKFVEEQKEANVRIIPELWDAIEAASQSNIDNLRKSERDL